MKQLGKTFLAALGVGAPTNTHETKILLERVLTYLERGTVLAGGITSFAYSGINIYDMLYPYLPEWAVWTFTAVGSTSCFFLIDLGLGVIAPVVIRDIITGAFRKNNAKALAVITLGCITAGQVATTTSWSAQGGYLLAEKMTQKPEMFVSSSTTKFVSNTPYDKDIESMEEEEQKIKLAVIKTASERAQSRRYLATNEWGYRAKKKNTQAIIELNKAQREASQDSASYVAKNYKPNKQLEEYREQKAKFLSIRTEDDSKQSEQERKEENIKFVEYTKKKDFIQGLIGELGQYSTYFFLLICVARISTQQGEASSYKGIRIWPFSWIYDLFSKKKGINDVEANETRHFNSETKSFVSASTYEAKVKNKSGDEETREFNYAEAKRKVQQYVSKLKSFTGNPTTNVKNILEFYLVMKNLEFEPAQEFLQSILDDKEIPHGSKNLLKKHFSDEGII